MHCVTSVSKRSKYITSESKKPKYIVLHQSQRSQNTLHYIWVKETKIHCATSVSKKPKYITSESKKPKYIVFHQSQNGQNTLHYTRVKTTCHLPWGSTPQATRLGSQTWRWSCICPRHQQCRLPGNPSGCLQRSEHRWNSNPHSVYHWPVRCRLLWQFAQMELMLHWCFFVVVSFLYFVSQVVFLWIKVFFKYQKLIFPKPKL